MIKWYFERVFPTRKRQAFYSKLGHTENDDGASNM
jgi:hypothetical protein